MSFRFSDRIAVYVRKVFFDGIWLLFFTFLSMIQRCFYSIKSLSGGQIPAVVFPLGGLLKFSFRLVHINCLHLKNTLCELFSGSIEGDLSCWLTSNLLFGTLGRICL